MLWNESQISFLVAPQLYSNTIPFGPSELDVQYGPPLPDIHADAPEPDVPPPATSIQEGEELDPSDKAGSSHFGGMRPFHSLCFQRGVP